MPSLPLDDVFADALQVARGLSEQRGEDFNRTECDVLTALCLVIPQARLTAVIATAENPDRNLDRQWSSIGVENYAVRMPQNQLWTLCGPIAEQAWKDQACIELSLELERANRHSDHPFRLEIDPSIGIDPTDPRVVEVLDLLHPRVKSLQSAQTLGATTPPVANAHHRRL